MLGALRESAADAGIENIAAVEASWEEADVEPHDVVLCANVVYGVAEIGGFVRKLEEAARDRVAIVLYMDAPLSRMSPIWTEVHGEKRIDMPGLPELLPVLWEMEIYPDVAMLPPATSTRSLPNLETAIAFARHFLYIEAGSEKEQRLREIAAPVRGRDAGGRDDARGERTAARRGVVAVRGYTKHTRTAHESASHDARLIFGHRGGELLGSVVPR